MNSLDVIVPVAPDEPFSIVKRSVEHLSNLQHPDDTRVSITYVVDQPDDPARYRELEQEDIEFIFREDTAGKRAGALLYALDQLDPNEYVSFLDVDIRPDEDFLPSCLQVLESHEDCRLVTGQRFITNAGEGWVPRMVAQGYHFLNDQQRLAQLLLTYNHTNGCNGVLDADAVRELGFNTDQLTPDVDFTERMYRNGWHMRVTDETRIGEQAPVSFSDFYQQQKRWMGGATENLFRHYSRFLRTNPRIALGWYGQLLFPYLSILTLPLIPLYGIRTAENYARDMPLLGTYIFFYWFTSTIMLFNVLRGRTQRWVTPERSEI
ncbi:MAG: glycosyltransferase family 2 protein [Candidatus Nanohaloarchaea archaeon]|nr:glycosyltransferase family 2 protein [Candidatus Nanohaloarchaea archaeon]